LNVVASKRFLSVAALYKKTCIRLSAEVRKINFHHDNFPYFRVLAMSAAGR
jgi:hypothetical protein